MTEKMFKSHIDIDSFGRCFDPKQLISVGRETLAMKHYMYSTRSSGKEAEEESTEEMSWRFVMMLLISRQWTRWRINQCD